MIDVYSTQFSIFIVAAIVLAITPGASITYVIARTASGGNGDGLASALGTTVGGLVHVVAAALGLSILISESATAFSIIKYAGACYLAYLGIRILMSDHSQVMDQTVLRKGRMKVFWEGVMIETFNVKTALFFLAFIPQFINPDLPISGQFVIYGVICVALNCSTDLLAVFGSAFLLKKFKSAKPLNIISGSTLVGLGAFVAFSGKS